MSTAVVTIEDVRALAEAYPEATRSSFATGRMIVPKKVARAFSSKGRRS